jgi:sensitive to high expression protein 9, mitochondrial
MLEKLIKARKLELVQARDAYSTAVDKHTGSLRETRDLLTRKDDWSETDALKFASLHTSTRADEQAVQVARRTLQAAEISLENETERLSSKIGAVYQAESRYNATVLQVKTWWTWAVMAFNVFIFLFNVYLIQIGLNPRYRKDMNLSDESITKIRHVLLEATSASDTSSNSAASAGLAASTRACTGADGTEVLGLIEESTTGQSEPITPVEDTVNLSFEPDDPSQSQLVQQAKALLSPSLVTWPMIDITSLAIQSAAAGMVTMFVLMSALQRYGR